MFNKILETLLFGIDFIIRHMMNLMIILNIINISIQVNFEYLKIILVSVILTIFVHTEWELFEISWCFSIWLESLAILP